MPIIFLMDKVLPAIMLPMTVNTSTQGAMMLAAVAASPCMSFNPYRYRIPLTANAAAEDVASIMPCLVEQNGVLGRMSSLSKNLPAVPIARVVNTIPISTDMHCDVNLSDIGLHEATPREVNKPPKAVANALMTMTVTALDDSSGILVICKQRT